MTYKLSSVSAAALATAFLLVSCGDGTSGSSATAQNKMSARAKTAVTAASYEQVVQSLYIAYFGRPADPTSLANFEADLMAGDAPTDIADLNNAYSTNTEVYRLVNSFQASAESQALYGNSSTTDFVTAIYNNVLGRAPDSSGLSYWVGSIDGNTLTRGDAALSIMSAAANNTSGTTQGATDEQLVNNRLTVAAYFTAQVSSQGAVNAYSGNAAAATARSMLSNVTSATSTGVFDNYAAATVTGLANNVSVAGSASAYSANSYLSFSNNANSTVILDAQGNQYAVDATSYDLVALSSKQLLTGFGINGESELIYNGNIVGYIGLVASGSSYIAQLYYTADGDYGTGSMTMGSGSYAFNCSSTCGSNTGSGSPVALQAIDDVVGTGATAQIGDTVTVTYTGWLYNGSAANLEGMEFDSSSEHGGSYSFILGIGNVIEGWDQGVIGMKVGGTRTLIIPSILGYGASAEGSIPANSSLVFTVQLTGVQ